MGWCHEFGPQIKEGCDHPMTVRGRECGCDACGVVCPGRYAGCQVVWTRNRPPRLRRKASSEGAGKGSVRAAPVVPEPEAPPLTVEQAVDARLQPVLDELRESASPGAWADRVAASIAAVLVPLLKQMSDGGAGGTPELAQSQTVAARNALADIHAAASELNAELVRLRAFRSALTADMPGVAAAIDDATGRAKDRLEKVSDEIDGLIERPY